MLFILIGAVHICRQKVDIAGDQPHPVDLGDVAVGECPLGNPRDTASFASRTAALAVVRRVWDRRVGAGRFFPFSGLSLHGPTLDDADDESGSDPGYMDGVGVLW